MISFNTLDIAVIILFFIIVLFTGFYSGRRIKSNAEDYLLSGRRLGLFLFVLTNVATWYGGILGVGEFTYRYGIVSWITQGLPYYLFAVIFAFFFAKKIRAASLFTIPDKLEQVYGKKAALVSSVLIFILVSPAPYLLMLANLISLIFNIKIIWSLLIAFIISAAYLYKGGFTSDIYTDVVEFFFMFAGFIIILAAAYISIGDFTFLANNLPEEHLTFTGGASWFYILVWFLIALWTFTDPGFHQRCYAAKEGSIAFKGILISIIFWALFDFLTTTTGLYSKAVYPDLDKPVLAYPMLAEKVLGAGFKGLFYAAMLATILSTLNSFLFLSGTTFSKDLLPKSGFRTDSNLKRYAALGLTAAGILSIILAYFIPSVIELWYTIGTICIPGLILPVMGAYYEKFKISSKICLTEIITGTAVSLSWFLARENFKGIVYEIEPMIVGLMAALVIHLIGLGIKKN